MGRNRAKALTELAALALGLLFALTGELSAERLPVKSYTTADGLPVDIVLRIKRDSHGFLWFCTRDGLSKFDGYQFTNFGKEQGLSHPQINDLIEAKDGTYWAATNGGGVCRFNPAARPTDPSASRFTVYSLDHHPASNIVNCLSEDVEGRIWAGTDQGLFTFDPTRGHFLAVVPEAREIYSLLADREGRLWIGAENQLWRRSPDGQVARYSFQVDRNPGRIYSLIEDDQRKLWAGSWHAGLFELDPKLLPLDEGVLQVGKPTGLLNQHTTANGAVIGTIVDLHRSSDGHLWIVATRDYSTLLGGGLFEFDGQRFRRYGKAQGLTSDFLQCLAEDREGNFWLGSAAGAMKLARNGFTTFGEADGLHNTAMAMFETRAGELCLVTEKGMIINRFAGGRFIATRLNAPRALENRGLWGTYQITLQDHAGDWWVPTLKGLMRFAGVPRVEQLARARPKAHYLLDGGRGSFDIFRMFEDSRGDIWVSLASNEKNSLVKWERATEKFRTYGEADGVTPFNPPTAFCEDAHRNLWIGLYRGGLLRYREGRFERLGSEDGLPSGLVTHLYIDLSRRLWVASSSDGVAHLDDTNAERPRFVGYTVANGLSSNVVFTITEDNWGRIYFGTVRSVDRLNPVTGTIRRYTAADGLPLGYGLSFRDRDGALWFTGFYEVARLMPEPDEQQPPPPVLISGVRVNGGVQSIADLGETEMRGLELGPGQNHIQIDFVGLAFGAGEALQYQYRLEGADADWQPMAAVRTVNYANLAPGAYRFLVRARNTDGRFSPTVASVEFAILAPIYQRWWFLTLAAMAFAGSTYALYRYRVFQLLKVERMRTRIASDLHDDIGSSLSQISIISEVVRTQLGREDSSFADPLSTIAQTSRELVDSMSDIVWAINPERDTLQDLVQRMRHFVMDTLTGQEIHFDFVAPDRLPETHIDTDMRREVFLIFKEAVNNAIRHSYGSLVKITLSLDDGKLQLAVADNGRGFETAKDHRRHGLVSMRQRAKRIGGELEISSTHGSGTEVSLRAPLKTHRRARI